tara:strand:+ start:516 stop:692 length:177 start_codon:yes stop_codon:yes gene_type:complete
MKTKEKVLVYAEDLEKIAALVDDLALEIDRYVNSCDLITYNNLALSMEKLIKLAKNER